MDETDTQATGAVAPEAPATDTATTQTSEASELSQGTPEATQSQEETTELKTEDTVQEEKLYAGKYKTAEDMEKAYKELESKFGRETSEKAELTRILSEAFMPPAADKSEDTAYQYQDDDSATKDDGTKRDIAVLKFTIAHPDADGESMKKVLQSDPMLANITGHEARLEYAYLRARDMNRHAEVSQAQKTAQQATVAKIAEKEVARVESAKKAEPADQGNELYKQATSGSPDERKAARQALIRKHLTKL